MKSASLILLIAANLAHSYHYFPRTFYGGASVYHRPRFTAYRPYSHYASTARVSTPVQVAAPAVKRYSYKFVKPQASAYSASNIVTASASLAFLKNSFSNDACGKTAEAYIKTIVSGGSAEQATAEARSVYIRNYRNGIQPAFGTPCGAAGQAFQAASAAGEDPVLAAGLAYVRSSSGSSPCLAASRSYIEALAAGSSESAATLSAAKSFTSQFQSVARSGLKQTIDPTCTAAAKSYASSFSGDSSPFTAAMLAFINKAVETGNSFDPVCANSADQILNDFSSSSKSYEALTIGAARRFLKDYRLNPTSARNSPCTAAARAYATAVGSSQTEPTQKALFAFIDEAVFSNGDGFDPVCGAAAEAYLDNYVTGGKEAANEAAALAYINALDANPAFNTNSPCGRAAQAYINSSY